MSYDIVPTFKLFLEGWYKSAGAFNLSKSFRFFYKKRLCMQNSIIKTICLLSYLVFSSCEKIDLRSALMSYEKVSERFDQSMEWNISAGISGLLLLMMRIKSW